MNGEDWVACYFRPSGFFSEKCNHEHTWDDYSIAMDISIEVTIGDQYVGRKYAVRSKSIYCGYGTLNRHTMKFVYEALPSNRDANHYDVYRFDTFEEAVAAANVMLDKSIKAFEERKNKQVERK